MSGPRPRSRRRPSRWRRRPPGTRTVRSTPPVAHRQPHRGRVVPHEQLHPAQGVEQGAPSRGGAGSGSRPGSAACSPGNVPSSRRVLIWTSPCLKVTSWSPIDSPTDRCRSPSPVRARLPAPSDRRWSSASARAGTRISSSSGKASAPGQVPQGQPVRVGGHQPDARRPRRDQHAGQQRPGVVARRRPHHLAKRLGQRRRRQERRRLGRLGQRRELDDREGAQAEASTGPRRSRSSRPRPRRSPRPARASARCRSSSRAGATHTAVVDPDRPRRSPASVRSRSVPVTDEPVPRRLDAGARRGAPARSRRDHRRHGRPWPAPRRGVTLASELHRGRPFSRCFSVSQLKI